MTWHESSSSLVDPGSWRLGWAARCSAVWRTRSWHAALSRTTPSRTRGTWTRRASRGRTLVVHLATP